MAYYSGGGGTGGNNPPPRRPPPYPLRDTWMKSPPDYNSAPSSVQHGQPYHPHQRTPCDPDTEIYENIYDSRWRLLNQEAARLQREQTWTPSSALSPTPPPVAGSSSSRESSLDPSTIHTASASVLSTRSPRQIIIQRSEDGFGFTLRHFIVYPPEEPTPEQIRVDIKEPLDTIFVKSVRESGPAHLAGLQCGDRIISVNGESVSGKSYAEVVGLIQRLRDNLSLIVVPKQDDILQMYFSDIAQNPETNPRPVTATPSREFHSSGYLPALPRETSPFSEFVTNGPTRIMMPGHQQPQNYRVPEPIPPPWMGQHPPGLPSNASSASVATSTSTTEHAYAMPARVVRTSESLERVDPRSVGSLVSLNDNSWNQRTASVASSRTLGSEAAAALATTTTGESVPSNDSDPVISRIKRDFERKQEFLRTTNLPNYLASPVSEEQQAQGPQQHPVKGGGITQEEQRQQATAPVYFGDRFPIHHPRLDEEDGAGGPLRGSNEAQFHLYGLPLESEDEVSEEDEDSEVPLPNSSGIVGGSSSKNFDTSASTPNLLPSSLSSYGKSPHNKRRGLSETPEIQRKSRKLFAARTRDVDKLPSAGETTEKVLRKRSLTGLGGGTGGRSSIDETESSRKSSVSSGHRGKRQQKQFAVTLLVSENDKNKIMDMLQKAKSVISKKVEKVMGKKPQKSDISNADALKTVLQNWVDEAETEEKQEEFDEDELIAAQENQVAHLRSRGYDPPVHLRPMPTTTVISPVPEEEGEEDDIEVQEVMEGQTSFLLPPKAQFKLERSSISPRPMSRSLTPCDAVPRPAFLTPGNNYHQLDQTYKLRRPSSHYDASAQACSSACSRPVSRNEAVTSPPVFDYSAFARAKVFNDIKESWTPEAEENEMSSSTRFPQAGGPDNSESDSKIQRPESMVIPIGGVWRPDDEPVDLFLEADEDQFEEGEEEKASECHETSYRRSGRQFEEDETYHIQQQQQQQQQPQFGTTQALSHLHHHHHQAHQHLNTPNRSSPNHPTPHSYHHPRQSYLNAHYDGSIIPGGGGGAGGAGAPTRSNGPVVLRRKKKQQQQQQQHLDDEEERNLRRVSYLRATKEDRMHIDSDAEDPEHLILPSTPKHSTTSEHGADGVGTPRHAPSIQRIRALFGEKGDESQSPQTGCPPESLREGWLHCKVTAVEGKKSVDRSWRNVYAVLTSDSLSVYKDKKIDKNNQLSFEEVPPIILSESGVEVADDYTKRKYVFRLKTQSASEVLFQAESEANLSHWIDKLEPLAEASVNASSQAPASTPASANPLASSGGRKLTSTRNRSPTGHSPATKNRKPSADQGPMTKENSHKKTWKGKVAKQWKRMQGSTSTTGNSAYPEGGSIGVPLEDCPMCPDLECVPMIVRTCCTMVEDNGLDIVGIYRVPGNSAAVTALTEQVNSRGEEVFLKLDDPKWHDVNVVTSLLKSFFRKLPDPIFTTDMYNVFIEMSKIEECNRRLNALRKLIRELPEVHFETLHHLCQHLVRVIDHSEINKMEVRNLAIVFGPTLVRPADDNMMSMVTDMSQQCRIIESILSHFEWFFSDDEEELDEEDEVSEAHMDLVKLNEPGHENNHSVLLSNLQKLEEAGKMSSSSSNNKEVSAKDIMSGIISAANRKMLRSQNKSSTSSSKKDSVGNETSKSTPKLDHLDKSASSNATSRRNSESVFHGAVAIAAAVPQLMVNAGNSMSTSNLPTAGIVTSSSSSTQVQAASQENLINSVESTVMSSSTSRIVSTAFYDESGFKEDSTGKKIKFPIETYQGLEKATAERVRRFVDETKANLMRGRLESSPNLNNARTTSDAHVETWTDDLAGGILFQDDPYPVNAYNERVQAQDRFLNLTYRSPSVIKTPEHHHRMMRASHSGGGNQNQAYFPHRAGLTRGLSLGELNPPRELLTPHEFDTKKVASHGTLKRLKLVKSPTDTQLFVPNHHGHHHHQLHHPLVPLIHDPAASDSMLTSLTHDFDEKMKLLLDPNYSSQSDTSSVQSTPSKYAKLRRVSDHQNQSGSTNYSKTSRSISLGEDSQNLNEKQLSILNEQQQRTNKKSELKRGRVVDKNHPRPQRPTSGAEDVDEGKENKKVRSRNRRLRRRHTVGGTKDFVDVEAATEAAIEDQPRMSSQEGLLDLQPSNYHYTVMMNVDRSLGQWIRRQQKIGKSSPDLSIIGRRLSLPDTVLANSAAFYPSLLESQV